MILGSSDGEHADVMVPANPSKVRPQASPQLLRDRLAAILGAEDHVDVISGEDAGQSVAPSATQNAQSAFWR